VKLILFMGLEAEPETMSKVLVCQHVPYEILGTLNPLFKKRGFRIQYLNFGRHPDLEPELDGSDALVILGGPMHVSETREHPHLLWEMRLIEEALRQDIPVLGICLGAQLIAKTLGAEVQINQEREIGWHDLQLTEEGEKSAVLRHFKPLERMFQWHRDTFDIPRGALQLARSNLCENQAFRYGEKVYAFQFHLEVDEPMIERWLQVPEHQEILQAMQGKVCASRIREETRERIEGLKQLSQKTFTEFTNLLGAAKKFQRLGSR